MPKTAATNKLSPFTFLATLVLIFGILIYAQRVLEPIAVAILFAFLLTPVVRAVQRRGLPRVPAVLVVALAAFVLMGTIAWGITSQFAGLTKRLPEYETRIRDKIAAVRQGEEDSLVSRFMRFFYNVKNDLTNTRTKVPEGLPESAASTVGLLGSPLGQGPLLAAAAHPPGETAPGTPGQTTPAVTVGPDLSGMMVTVVSTAWEVIRLLASVAMVGLLVIVMLIYREDLRDRMIRLSGFGRLTVTTKALDEAGQRISNYMFRKSLVNAGFGVVVSLVLFPLVPFAVLWGFLLAVLRFIPSLGTWLAIIPPVLFALAANETWWPVFAVVGLFLIGELVCTNGIEPWLIGKHIGVSPLGGLVSLTLWTWAWGPVGLVLAIPLTICLVVLGKYVPQVSFLSVLLSDQPAMETNVRYYQRLLAMDPDEAVAIVEEYLKANPPETVYDELILPALSYAKRDHIREDLTKEDMKFIAETTTQILEELWSHDEIPASVDGQSLPTPTFLLGCAVHDQLDDVGLLMLKRLLAVKNCQMETASAAMLSAEVVKWVETQQPALICLVTLGPGDWAMTRFLCKRLHRRFPDLKIIVVRLGTAEEEDANRDLVLKAGAYSICTTLLDARNQVVQAVSWLKLNPSEKAEKALLQQV